MNLADFPFSGRHALNFSLLLDKNKFLPIRWKKFIYKSYRSKKKSLKCINSNILKNVLLFLKKSMQITRSELINQNAEHIITEDRK